MKKKKALHHIARKTHRIDFFYMNFPILTSGVIEVFRPVPPAKPKTIFAKKKAHRMPL